LVVVSINAPDGRSLSNPGGHLFYLDAWFDWDADGLFEANEVVRAGSIGTGRLVVGDGDSNTLVVDVPASAVLGETYARFRLSESPTTGPSGDASSGEVEDVRIVVASNQFRNATDATDVNASGETTPIDVLQIINTITRNGIINLSQLPVPSDLPQFPDVDGNGTVEPLDALLVINELSRRSTAGGALGEGEAFDPTETLFVPAASGVLASTTTALGDSLLNEVNEPSVSTIGENTELAASLQGSDGTQNSVFAPPALLQIEDLVDTLAQDASDSADEVDVTTEILDQLFSEL